MKQFMDLMPRKERTLSPADFIQLSVEEKRNIESSRFVPPVPGDDDFGRFEVVLKNPVYQFTPHAD